MLLHERAPQRDCTYAAPLNVAVRAPRRMFSAPTCPSHRITLMPSAYRRLKHVLFGRPLASERLEHERLNKKTALAVLSSDAISSVAYATDQILFVLGGAIGLAAVNYVLGISAVIVGLLVLVGLSYRQTVFAYPNGGGSYTVARENLGVNAGLVAA